MPLEVVENTKVAATGEIWKPLNLIAVPKVWAN